MVWPSVAPLPLLLLWTSSDGLLSSLSALGVCCCLTDSSLPLGSALFSLSLTLNLQTVSNSAHYPTYPPSLLLFQPYCVACYFSNTGRRAGWILLLLLNLLPDNKEKSSQMSVIWFLFKRWRKKQKDVTGGVYSYWLSSCPFSNKKTTHFLQIHHASTSAHCTNPKPPQQDL